MQLAVLGPEVGDALGIDLGLDVADPRRRRPGLEVGTRLIDGTGQDPECEVALRIPLVVDETLGNYNIGSPVINWLTSPAITLGSSPATLTFREKYRTESGWDNCQVMTAINAKKTASA